jgi:hypothetical protein
LKRYASLLEPLKIIWQVFSCPSTLYSLDAEESSFAE